MAGEDASPLTVDTHAHLTPQAMLDALARGGGRFPNVAVMHEGDAWRLGFAGRAPTRPVAPRLRDTDQRRAWLADNGIDRQVVGGWLDSFGYELPAEEGLAWSRFMNEHLMGGTAGLAEIAPLATVPLQDGRLAAAVLNEALDAGFAGVMIGTQPKGDSGNLDDPGLDPFWQAASDRKATVFLHPMYGCGDPRLEDFDLINAVGRGVDTSIAVARLLFAGHLTRYPGMALVLSHGGGGLPYLLGRLARNRDIHKGEYADPVEGFRRLYFDTVLFDPDTLRFLVGQVGGDKVMLGSDYPFPIGDPAPVDIVRAARLGEIDTRRILGETAARLFRLDAACAC